MDPQTIGSYTIQGELGRGAMGVVYQGYDPAIGRPVAIKVIRIDAGTTADRGAQLRQRLVREASAAGKLSHPGIVTVHQLGEEEQAIFIVMELVAGSSLEQRLASGRSLDGPWILEVFRQVAEALDYAHQAGVVHRDIKPANILVGEDGRIKVADFGIAKMTESATQGMTATGLSIGSPAYMSPEQVRAEAVDGRSDQFALGIMAFQVLTGRLPFGGDTAHAIMFQIVSFDPLSSAEGLARPVAAVLAKAMAKEPKDRYASCAAFISALTKAVGATTQSAQAATEWMPSPQETRTEASAKRSLLIPIVLMFSCLTLILAVGGAYWLFKRNAGGSGSDSTAATNRESPLIKAIAEGRLDDAKALLAKGADVNAAKPDGTTALMQAAEGSSYLALNAPAVSLLLDKGASIQLQDKRGRSALYRAASEGKEEALRLLLSHQADPNQRAQDGSTPLLTAISYGKASAMRLLLEGGADPDLADAQGTTPLMLASEGTAYMPYNAPLVEILLGKGAKIEAQDARGRTALYRGASAGKAEAARLLLDKKANANQRAADGSSPLLEAVIYGRVPTIELLLESGALVDLADPSGTTPLMVAAEGTAYMPDNAPMVTRLLQAKAKVDLQDARGRSALYRAAAEGKEDAIRLLLDQKANPNLKAADGSTPLLQAVTYGKGGAAALLLERGAEANLANASGETPLMVAAGGSAYIKSPGELVTLLISHGAQTDLTDARGRTALARATESQNTAAIALLKN